jgi:hypothetical protein
MAEDWDDEDADEDGFEDPRAEALDALRRIERHRDSLRMAARDLAAVLDAHPKLKTQWDTFTRRLGGISAEDFARHLDGQIIRRRRTRTRKHLRLVSEQPPKPVLLKKRPQGGGHAA